MSNYTAVTINTMLLSMSKALAPYRLIVEDLAFSTENSVPFWMTACRRGASSPTATNV